MNEKANFTHNFPTATIPYWASKSVLSNQFPRGDNIEDWPVDHGFNPLATIKLDDHLNFILLKGRVVSRSKRSVVWVQSHTSRKWKAYCCHSCRKKAYKTGVILVFLLTEGINKSIWNFHGNLQVPRWIAENDEAFKLKQKHFYLIGQITSSWWKRLC